MIWRNLNPEHYEAIVRDPGFWLDVDPDDIPQVARTIFRMYYPRAPGTPAVPSSYGPACGMRRVTVTARTPSGELVL